MCKRVSCLTILCVLGWAYVASAGGLVGWWKLDETSGTSVSDSSGNNITGNLVGTPKWVAGKIGGALELDGKSWVDFGNPPKTLMTGTTPVAVALWINPANLGTILSQSGHDRAFLWRNQDWAFKASGPFARFTTPGVLDYNATNTLLKLNEWQHVAVVFRPSAGLSALAVFYLNGIETDRVPNTTATNGGYNAAAATVAASTVTGGHVALGNNQWSTATANQSFIGLYDDVQLYDRELTAADIQEIFGGSCAQSGKAEKPDPADKAVGVTQPTFQWTAGEGAVLHNVYAGTKPELTAADLGLTGSKIPVAMYFHLPGLQPGVTYYWRVDEIDSAGKVTTGAVWSFTAMPTTAWAPKPSDGSVYVTTAPTLGWSGGVNAGTYDLYLGPDRAAVEAGAADTKKAEKLTTASYAATGLEKGKTYFWRVDETLADGTKAAGSVWSFATYPVIAKADPNLVGWWKLDDEKAGVAIDSSGNDNHGTLQGGVRFVPGYLGEALLFDEVDDWVDCGTDASLENVGSVSVSAWIMRYRTAGDRKIVSNQNNLTTNGGGYKLGVYSNDKVEFEVRTAANSSTNGLNRNVVGGTVLEANVWYHVVGVYEKGKALRTYVNGKLDRELATTIVAGISNGVFRIGRESYSNSYRWVGLIDDVRVYNKALTEAEVQKAMQGDPRLAWSPQPASSTTVDIRSATSLSWTAGEGAAQHDVYLGKDRDAVRMADKTSPLYKGRQAGTSFPLDGLVEVNGGAYFWRIDEVEADGTTVHKGVIWTFTIPAYLIVDEFENYTDKAGGEIFSAWIDGFADNYKSSGSTVGYPTAANGTFGETTIIHSGKQSMPMDYNNVKAPFFSEAVQTFAPLQDWTVSNPNILSVWFQGQPLRFADKGDGAFTIGASGADIWGTADDFRFVFKQLNGDGSIVVKVDSLVNTHASAKAGVMIRESLADGSPMIDMIVTATSGVGLEWRATPGASAVATNAPKVTAIRAPQWIKLMRKGNVFTAQYSADGQTWLDIKNPALTGTPVSVTVNMASNVYIGLCVTSHAVAATTTAQFSGATTTGNVTGAWQQAWIGNDPDRTNAPAGLYAIVEDSTGKSVTVAHPDPAVATLSVWTEWKIPLSDLTGVSLAKIKKLYLGVGDRKSPGPDGYGRIYFDDIRVIKQ